MRRIVLFVCFALAMAGCKYSLEAPAIAIVGPTLIDGSGAPPVADAVVIIEGTRIRAAGPRAVVPIPKSAQNVDGRGKYVAPLKSGQTIRAGSPADLMLLDTNPLAGSGSKPAAVMENGQWIR